MNILSSLSEIWCSIKASISPFTCVSCKEILKIEGLCKNCQKQIKPVVNVYVDAKRRTTIPVMVVGAYEGVLRKLVQEKYKKNKYAFHGAAELIYEYQLQYADIDLLIPAPLHKSKAKKRGFDQVLELSKYLSKISKIPVSNIVKRIKDTKSQTSLSKKERLENLSGAFELDKFANLKDKNIAIIDDVYTTGATVSELVDILLPLKPNSITIFTVARSV